MSELTRDDADLDTRLQLNRPWFCRGSYGPPMLEKVRAMKPSKEADQHRAPPPPNNHGANISKLIRMIEAGEL